MARPIPFLFISHLFSVQNQFVFPSTSVRSLCAFSVRFESISYSFHLLHVAVYDFYSSVKSMQAGQQFACGGKKVSESYRSDTDSLSARLTRFAQSHTCLRVFCSCSSDSCRSTVHQIMALALELPYVHTYRLHVQEDWS